MRRAALAVLIGMPGLIACRSRPVGDDSRSSAPQARQLRFLALGDSYTIGESVDAADRWPAQLVAALRARAVPVADPLIIAKTGWTTDELSAGIDAAAPAGPFDLVSLLIGVNNQYRHRGAVEYRIQFHELLARAIGLAAGRPSRVLVLSIPDWGVTPFAAGRDAARIAAEIDQFNSINRAEALAVGAQYVDVTPVSRKAPDDRTMVAADGLHPSAKMYGEWTLLAAAAAGVAIGDGR
jgi:lysophospholipase L1-like esterase